MSSSNWDISKASAWFSRPLNTNAAIGPSSTESQNMRICPSDKTVFNLSLKAFLFREMKFANFEYDCGNSVSIFVLKCRARLYISDKQETKSHFACLNVNHACINPTGELPSVATATTIGDLSTIAGEIKVQSDGVSTMLTGSFSCLHHVEIWALTSGLSVPPKTSDQLHGWDRWSSGTNPSKWERRITSLIRAICPPPSVAPSSSCSRVQTEGHPQNILRISSEMESYYEKNSHWERSPTDLLVAATTTTDAGLFASSETFRSATWPPPITKQWFWWRST